ncbi:2-oxo-4-hydroxy-4-carboxy-5-ureidoimidazoline decarboxylase, partial [Streptomyces sp. URMC 123]|uniref:2-oxo-4-hydroxy-4-carboxy-5-ureidoimidazoline decarboxylase n=1 Tax=Streptomyces sp. URMC 123 TaxID=3423403 RepID=UPI003F1BFCF6
LGRFNAAPAGLAEAALLRCCASRSWARRVAAGRPYPSPEALFDAADEASRQLTAADLAQAVAGETAARRGPYRLPGSLGTSGAPGAPGTSGALGALGTLGALGSRAPHGRHSHHSHQSRHSHHDRHDRSALRAAHAAYESRFGHGLVICLVGVAPEERTRQVLAALRARLGHGLDEERAVVAEELRRLALERLHHMFRFRPP